MRLLDKIALNRLIITIMNFILSIIKLLQKSDTTIDKPVIKPKPSRPLLNKLKNIFKNE